MAVGEDVAALVAFRVDDVRVGVGLLHLFLSPGGQKVCKVFERNGIRSDFGQARGLSENYGFGSFG
jgi:hypothetical protein